MFRSVFSCVCFGLLAFAFVVCGGADLLAQTSEQVQFSAPNITWGTMANDMIGALTKVAVVGIGIGVSIWAILMIARVLRRSVN